MNRAATAGLIAAAVFYWTGFGGSFAGALSWRHQLVWHLGSFVASAAGGWLLWKRESPVRLRHLHPFLDACVGLILLEAALRMAFGQGWETPTALAEAVSLVILFYLLLQVGDDGHNLATGWLMAVPVLCLLGAWLAYQGGYRELAMPLGNRVLMGGLLVLVTPLTAGLWPAHRMSAVGVALAGLIMAAGGVKTRSASALVALALVALASGWRLVRFRSAVPKWLAAGSLALAAVAVLLTSNYEPLERLKAVLLAREDPSLSWDNRERYWAGAIPAVLERPVFGHGPGAVGVLYPKFRIQKPGLAPHGEIVPDLHSLPAQWLFQYGVAGLAVRAAAYVGFLLWVFARGGRLERSAGWALAAYGVFSLAHYQLATPGVLWAAVCVASIAAPRVKFVDLSARYARALGGGMILASLAIVLFQFRGVYANYLAERALREPAGQASASLVRAALLDPRGGFYDFLAALRIEERLAEEAAGPQRRFLIESGERHFAAAAAVHPWLEPVMDSWAGFRLRWEGPCDAIQPLETSVSLDFYSTLSHFNLANAYRRCGRPEAGVAEAAVGILAQPTLVYASAWRKEPGFLAGAMERALGWLESWPPPSKPADAAALRQMEGFLQYRLSEIRTERAFPVVSLTFSNTVGVEFQDDPFAFLFHRKAPRLETTRIQLDGLNTGSWAPGGIGSFPWLRALTYEQVRAACQRQEIERLIAEAGRP